jgi:hypothetical protein
MALERINVGSRGSISGIPQQQPQQQRRHQAQEQQQQQHQQQLRASSNVTELGAPPGVEGFAWPLRGGGAALDPAPADKLYMPMPYGIAAAVLFWTLTIFLTWVSPWLSLEFKQQHADRIMGGIHAVFATIFGLMAEFGTYAMCSVGRSWTTTAIQLTIGYMLVDLVSMLVCDVYMKWRKADPLMFAHHIYVIVFFSIGGLLDVGVWFFVIGMINEASTPLLSALFILKFSDSQSRLLMPIGMAFTATFFLCRILFLPFSYYQYSTLGFCDGGSPAQAFSAAMARPCYAFIYGLNCYWFYRTILGAMKAVKSKSDHAEKTDTEIEQVPNMWAQNYKDTSRFRYRLRSLWEP